jgi:uncharacterized membrane protein YdbT with pleckstrin-like domain
MRYVLRPAWRKQWFLLLLAIALLLIPLLPLIEALVSGAASESILDPTFLPLGLPFILIFLIMLYRHYSWRFTIEDGNLESRRGLIAREVNSIRIADVRNINVKQTLFERLLFVGDVEFSSAASDNAEVMFKGVSRPMRVKRKVQELL